MPHTPGPWMQHGSTIYSPDNGNVCVVTEIHTGIIGAPPIGITSEDWKEAMANARLIAAAPELLEACKHVMGNLTKADTQTWAYDLAKELRAAILKAEGGGDRNSTA